MAGDPKLEDSRVKGFRGKVTMAGGTLERTYCAYCTKPYGWASTEGAGLIAAAEVSVICDECFDKMNSDYEAPPGMTIAPDEFLAAHGIKPPETTYEENKITEAYRATKFSCPGCGKSDYHLEDNPDKSEGPQVAICHYCTNNIAFGGTPHSGHLKKGWLLKERVDALLLRD